MPQQKSHARCCYVKHFRKDENKSTMLSFPILVNDSVLSLSLFLSLWTPQSGYCTGSTANFPFDSTLHQTRLHPAAVWTDDLKEGVSNAQR